MISAPHPPPVVGDLHGQLPDLLTIWKLNGLPAPNNVYLFNGDVVDRGPNGCECLFALLAFKALYVVPPHSPLPFSARGMPYFVFIRSGGI